MSDNIISAIANLADFRNNNLKDYASKSLIRVNAVGEQLEFFIKDAIANSLKLQLEKKEENYSRVFSWLGNQNHPPDIIIKNGDAFEIKKIESPRSDLALNSSPPKDVLHSSDERITAECRRCEGKEWKEKDLFYVVGNAKGGIVNYLFIVQGNCYAASKEVYEKIHEPLKQEFGKIISSKGFENGDTVELGKVKRVDPLGITELRVRGMWQIENPIVVFSKYCKLASNKKFNLFAIMRKDKFNSFPKEDLRKLESNGVSIQDIKIKEPNNPAHLVDAMLISFSF